MDEDFNLVSDFVKSCYNLDFETYSNLICEKCNINYHFNGEYVSSNKDEYLSKLSTGHFQNTTNVKIIRVNISRRGNCYETDEIYHFIRKGFGKGENGSGIYEMKSRGVLVVSDKKIISIQYMFNKSKIE